MLILLSIVFIILKLLHVIDWSWWLLVSPSLIDVTLSLCIIVAFFAPKFHNAVSGLLANVMDTIMGRND